MSHCPSCKNLLREITIEAITLNGGPHKRWNGLTYSCPSCHCALTVGFDPLALQSDLLDRVQEIVRRN
jgi:hypothetical protein